MAVWTREQTSTLHALSIVFGDGVRVDHTTTARGLPMMPANVHTIRYRDRDHSVFLHPDGSLRVFYAPACE